jgi:N-acetylglucosamine malate deacetylase 1
MNILVIAPHPDDESIGCGGTICLHTTRGDHVAAVFLTSGEFALSDLTREQAWAIREAEAEESARILGITNVTFLRRPDHFLGAGIEVAAAALRPLLERQQPDLIYLPHAGDGHPDHRACQPIVQAALSGSVIPPLALLGYEVWTPLAEYDRAEDISEVMERKLQAIRAHRSQIKQIRYDQAARALNEYRGTMAQVGRYAEVFQFADDRFATVPRSRRTEPAWYRIYEVTQEIAKLVPPQDAFILVDEGRLEAAPLVAPRRCIPFLEKDGCYWGKPADDEAAIREVTRLRLCGANFMIFVSSTFWWLEHYPGLKRYLHSNFRCALKDDRLLAFDLHVPMIVSTQI